jgi:hypothetical protein
MAEVKTPPPEPWNEGRPPLLRTPTPGQDITRVLFPLSKMPEPTVPMETWEYGTPGGKWLGVAFAVAAICGGIGLGLLLLAISR